MFVSGPLGLALVTAALAIRLSGLTVCGPFQHQVDAPFDPGKRKVGLGARPFG
jgi:hypothetical protein